MSLSTPITDQPGRKESPSGRRRAAPPPPYEIASQVIVILWITAVAVAGLCIAILTLVQTGSPAGPTVAAVLAPAGGVVVFAGAAVAVRQLRDVVAWRPPVAPPQDVPAPAVEVANSPLAQHDQLFGTLANRLILLAAKGIRQVQSMENTTENSDWLKQVFAIDHLITQFRRQAENLAVIGGSPLPHRAMQPEVMSQILFAAMAETQRYTQISVVNPAEAYVRGHVVAELIHLLAELMDNAASFTSPTSPNVTVRAELVTAGVAIDIQDRGLGIPPERLAQLNALLDGNLDVPLDDVAEGRIGLTVAQILAFRHGIRVRLQANMFGGVDATVVVPSGLLVDAQTPQPTRRTPRPFPGPQPRPETATREQAPLARREPAPAATSAETSGRHAVYPAAPPGASWDTGTHRVTVPEEALPRRRPNATFAADAPAIAGQLEVPSSTPASRSDQPPPLPTRNRSYLNPNLTEPPEAAAPATGHDTGLLTDLRGARLRSDAETAPSSAGEPLPPSSSQPQEGMIP
jgi:hypothetical protein